MFEAMPANVLNPSLYKTADPEQFGLPLALYDELRRTSPCHRQELDEPGFLDWVWVVSRYEDVAAVDTNSALFTSTRGTTPRSQQVAVQSGGGRAAMIGMDGDQHSFNRKIVSRGFAPSVIAALESKITAMVSAVLDEALESDEFDFVTEISRKIPMRAICDLLGIPEEDRDRIIHFADVAAAPDEWSQEEVLEAAQEIWAYALELAALRRSEPADDLMTQVVAAHELDHLTEGELQGMMFVLVLAGNETTRNAMGHGLHALWRTPGQWTDLRTNFEETVGTAIEEILRVSSPVLGFRRQATADTTIAGQSVRQGDNIMMSYAAANFDPNQFPDPTRFDIRRSPNRHLAFGRGPHFCLGAPLARLELRAFLRAFVDRVESFEITGAPVYQRDVVLRGLKSLPIRIIKRT